MKLGGLFSGIGGFELAWTRLGGEVAWMCEWDKNARKVLEARFPGVPIYPDVRDLDPAEVEAVDVLTGGSPCQGFSVAGSRTGLEHSESQLFADYIRIMDGLAERGLKWALWENVPGVLSIEDDDGNRTFEHVVAALAGGTRPVRLDPERRWNTGLASRRGRAVAWRVLDSRYFGVAQRRRRVFACVAFGDSGEDRAGRALLAVAEGVRGDSSEGVAAGQGAAAGVAAGVGGASWWDGGDTAEALTRTSDDQRMPDKQRFQAVLDAPSGFRMTAFGQYEDDDSASTLKQRDHKDATDSVTDAPAVLMTMREGAPVTAHETGQGWWNEADYAATTRDEGTKRSTLTVQSYGVRRLTPVECERLQAFPDGWTEPAGSDSARYKALGNAVTVNTVWWIMRRIKALM